MRCQDRSCEAEIFLQELVLASEQLVRGSENGILSGLHHPNRIKRVIFDDDRQSADRS